MHNQSTHMYDRIRVWRLAQIIYQRNVMKLDNSGKTIVIGVLASIAVLFGVLTVISGGQVLFGGESYQQSAGNYVSFVVWFNFLAGFVYMVAGSGIWMRQGWAVWLSLIVAVATIIVFALFGMHIFRGGAYETRTVGAMSLRTIVWILIFIFSYRARFVSNCIKRYTCNQL